MPPPSEQPQPARTLQEVVDAVGLYPIEAYEFVQQGLSYTVNKIHGEMSPPAPPSEEGEDPAEPVSRHVDGRQLCEGLREFALMNWGMLARTVLSRWNIRRTVDFGRIVFALVDNGHMQKTEEDTIEDFRDVYDFRTAFEADYRIEQKSK